MKHGRTLIAALEALDARAGHHTSPVGPPPADGPSQLAPLRPGAFAAWAARREVTAPPEPVVGGAVRGARLTSRPPAV